MELEYEHILKLSAQELHKKALEYKNRKDYDNYCIYMIMSANYNYKLAEDDLYDDYINKGSHYKQNYNVTLKFYEKTQEYSYSANYLGYMYNGGFGVYKNIVTALLFYKKAIGKNNKLAIVNLAHIYYLGDDLLSSNYEKAIGLLELPIIKDFSVSYILLARMYGNENYNNKNYTDAIKLYTLAIDKGDSRGMYYLGKAYFDGELDLQKDSIKGKELLEKAIIKGNTFSMFHLANEYSIGNNIKKDLIEARKLYESVIDNSVECLVNAAIEKLISLYNTDLKEQKEYAINYFLKINKPEKLKEIYKYDDYHIQLLKENYKIKKELNELKTHLEASPEGKLYLEAKEEWDINQKLNIKLKN